MRRKCSVPQHWSLSLYLKLHPSCSCCKIPWLRTKISLGLLCIQYMLWKSGYCLIVWLKVTSSPMIFQMKISKYLVIYDVEKNHRPATSVPGPSSDKSFPLPRYTLERALIVSTNFCRSKMARPVGQNSDASPICYKSFFFINNVMNRPRFPCFVKSCVSYKKKYFFS